MQTRLGQERNIIILNVALRLVYIPTRKDGVPEFMIKVLNYCVLFELFALLTSRVARYETQLQWFASQKLSDRSQ